MTDAVEITDLYQYPTNRKRHKQTFNQSTQGDLHANTLNMLTRFIVDGFCDIEPRIYNRLALIYGEYRTGSATVEEEKEFISLLKNNLKLTNPNIFERLIGDFVGDRGSNDLFQLVALDVIAEQYTAMGYEWPSVTILFSNHDIALLRGYEEYEKTGVLEPVGIIDSQASSLLALNESLQNGVITKEEFKRLMDRYRQTLKIVDYSLSSTGHHIHVYSHAPIDSDVIKNLAQQLEVPYSDDSPQELANTIDRINEKFVNYVRNGELYLIYRCANNVKKNNPVHYVAWNRTEDLVADSTNLSAREITFVYGHTKNKRRNRTNIESIDTDFGKREREEDNRFVRDMVKGKYPALRSNDRLSNRRYAPLCRAQYWTERVFDAMQNEWGNQKEYYVNQLVNINIRKEQHDMDLSELELMEGRYENIVACYNALIGLPYDEAQNDPRLIDEALKSLQVALHPDLTNTKNNLILLCNQLDGISCPLKIESMLIALKNNLIAQINTLETVGIDKYAIVTACQRLITQAKADIAPLEPELWSDFICPILTNIRDWLVSRVTSSPAEPHIYKATFFKSFDKTDVNTQLDELTVNLRALLR